MEVSKHTSKELFLHHMLKKESGSISLRYIYYKKLLTFLKTSFTLQLFFGATTVLFVVFAKRLYFNENSLFSIDFILTFYLFSLLITTQLDAYSRYQNYKMVKDMLHINGFRGLIVKPFSRSQCQREAVKVAAKHLKILPLVKSFFYQSGYRWYHIIPSVLLENPFLFFTKGYWITTFFVPRYESKYFLW